MTSESRFRICLCVFRRDERRHPEDVFKLSNLSVNLSYQAQGQCAAAACYELVRIGRRDSTCKMQYTLLRVGSRVAYEHSDLLLRLLPLCLSVRVDDSTLSVQVWYSNIVMTDSRRVSRPRISCGRTLHDQLLELQRRSSVRLEPCRSMRP